MQQHSDTDDIAVVAMPDEVLGERTAWACMGTTPGPEPTIEELRGYLIKPDIAVEKSPERLETLPRFLRTASGKTQKHLFRQRIAETSPVEATGVVRGLERPSAGG